MQEAISTVFLLAAVQGILLSVILFTKKENHAANITLGCATLALSIDLAYLVYYIKGWYREFPHIMGMSYPFPFLYGPIFFIYAKLVTKEDACIHRNQILHLIPFFAAYILTVPYFLLSGDEKVVFLQGMLGGAPPLLFSIVGIFIPPVGIFYTVLTVRTVTRYHRSIMDSYSNTDRINLDWLKYLAGATAVIWTVATLNVYLQFVLPGAWILGAVLYILISALIYWIGYKGLQQPEIFMNRLHPSGPLPVSEKYRKSGLDETDAEAMKITLLSYMQKEKPYLDDELTLQKLAEQTGLSPHNLSEVINSRLNQSYYDFINGYRLEEFKIRLANPANDKYSLLSLAFDSGFKSKGTFNAIFKKQTGKTPSEYKAGLTTASE